VGNKIFLSGTKKTILEMTLASALIIGTVQGLAIAPGISRSGATIAFALFLGIERETSGRYSFLLSPARCTRRNNPEFFNHYF